MIDELRARVLALADAYDDIDETVGQLVVAAGVDAVSVLRSLVTDLRAAYHGGAAAVVARHALPFASGAAWIDFAIDVVVGHESDSEHDEARAALAELYARVPAGEMFAMRRRVGQALVTSYERELGIEQLRAALDDAPTDDDRVATAVELVEALTDDGDAARAVFEQWIGLAEKLPPSDDHARIVARLHHEQSRHDSARRAHHARIAAELVRAALPDDAELRHSSARWYAEQLVEAGELAEAEAWLVAARPETDRPDGLLDEIRRGLGTMPQDVPPELLVVDTPRGVIEPKLRAYLQPPSKNGIDNLQRYGPVSFLELLEWSHGEVVTAADLDSELIFGPRESYICTCKRYCGNVYKGGVCERCRVEILPNHLRATRAAHIKLAAPVPHPWLLSEIALLLGMSRAELRTAAEADAEQLATQIESFYPQIWRIEGTLGGMGPGRRRDEREHELALARWVEENVSGLRNLVLRHVPVMPPDAELGPDIQPAKLRAAYVRVLEEQSLRAVESLFRIFAGVLD